MSYLAPGLHSGKIADIRFFEESNRLYVYMVTGGEMHRESFGLTNGMTFLGLFLISAGIEAEKLSNQNIAKFPMHKLVGKEVYFAYTPPDLDGNGERIDGSYPRYKFHKKERWEALVAATQTVAEDVEIEVESAPSNGVSASAAPAKAPKKKKATAKKAEPAPKAKEEEDYGFLIDDDDD